MENIHLAIVFYLFVGAFEAGKIWGYMRLTGWANAPSIAVALLIIAAWPLRVVGMLEDWFGK